MDEWACKSCGGIVILEEEWAACTVCHAVLEESLKPLEEFEPDLKNSIANLVRRWSLR